MIFYLFVANYANLQNKSKEDAAMVEKRKRMLQKFLNRLAKHEILSYEHVFHRFLETGVSWVRLTFIFHTIAMFSFSRNLYFMPIKWFTKRLPLSFTIS